MKIFARHRVEEIKLISLTHAKGIVEVDAAE